MPKVIISPDGEMQPKLPIKDGAIRQTAGPSTKVSQPHVVKQTRSNVIPHHPIKRPQSNKLLQPKPGFGKFQRRKKKKFYEERRASLQTTIGRPAHTFFVSFSQSPRSPDRIKETENSSLYIKKIANMSFRGGGRGGGRGGAGGFRGGRGGGFQQRDMGPPAQVLGMAKVIFSLLSLCCSCFFN